MSTNLKKITSARASDWYGNIWKTVGKCVFCDLNEKYILAEEEEMALVMNKYPYTDGHLLVVPRVHIASCKELTESQWQIIRKFQYIARKLFKKYLDSKSSSIWTLIREGGVEAQVTVSDHLHIHLIPFSNPELCKWNFQEEIYEVEDMKNLLISECEIEKYAKKWEKKYKTTL
ncbi:HIT domain-containing protein [bacterium]|nr:MAG: HIT domain-containing protein [bacterium]